MRRDGKEKQEGRGCGKEGRRSSEKWRGEMEKGKKADAEVGRK